MKDQPAFPMVQSVNSQGNIGYIGDTRIESTGGMTLHQWFAGMALQGLLACPNTNTDFAGFASDSLKYADAVIAEYGKR
jgi:hypothetical protein